MKKLFFDAGPIITLALSNLTWILEPLKRQYNGRFFITPSVHYELVKRPLTVNRFKFEALQVMKLIRLGVVEVYDSPIRGVKSLKALANSSFKIGNKNVDILQEGELESLSCALEHNTAIVMDERTLRLFIENSSEMESLLGRRFKRPVIGNAARIKEFSQKSSGAAIIRSIELVSVAYKLGFLDSYIPKGKLGREQLVDAVLWATKYNGCAVTIHEIAEIKKFLLT